jgi:hypothetical protein
VVAVSLIGRRWGVAAAGLFGGLPVVAGPILLLLTVIHGRHFGSESAAGTVLGLGALTMFVLIYGHVARIAGPGWSVCAGWAGFLAAVGLLSLVHPPRGVAFAAVGAGFLGGLFLLPDPHLPPATPESLPWWDLPARGLATAALVMALTAASGKLGPGLSGLLAPFPIVTAVLAMFTQAQLGFEQLIVLLRNFLAGFYGFATFCLVVAVCLPSMAVLPAFALAVVAAVAVQAAGFPLRRRIGLLPR